jgi:hypothetical protein
MSWVLLFASRWFHSRFIWWGPCCYYFNVLCCSIMCLYVLSCVLLFQLPFPHKNDFQFVFTSSCLYENSCLIYVICVCLRILVSNTCCVGFLFCFVLCTLCCQFLSIVIINNFTNKNVDIKFSAHDSFRNYKIKCTFMGLSSKPK